MTTERSRTRTSGLHRAETRLPRGTPLGFDTHAGMLAAAAWLSARGLEPQGRPWDVEIVLGIDDRALRVTDVDDVRATRFQISVYSVEWGFRFVHEGAVSWIRITDVPFVHGRDDHGLIGAVPPLKDIGALIRDLERKHGIRFRRQHALVQTSIPDAAPVLASWVRTL